MEQESNHSAESALEMLARAIEANLKTPTREENVVLLDAESADDVMITADLHGHWDNYHQIMAIADLDAHPRRHLVMQEVCHGGPQYEGKHACKSHLMLREVAELKVKYPHRVHFILSNHELSEMTDHPIAKDGKMVTLAFRMGISAEYGDASDSVHEAYMTFIGSCPLAVRLPSGVLVTHSAPQNVDTEGFDATVFNRVLEPDDIRKGGDVFRMVWGRDYREENAQAFAEATGAKIFIHGHTPCDEGFDVPNKSQIILDCCAQPASYVILPMDADLTQEQVVERIKLLE
ncbi:MAG: metallophosphoesterase [Planctomycetales bacterium]